MGPHELRKAARQALQQRHIQRANTLFIQAATAEGKDPEALAVQGAIDLENGKLERASQSIRQALEANPLNLKALLGMARIAMSLGQFQEAAAYVSTAHQVDPSSGLAHSLGGMLFELFGDPVAAFEAAEAGHRLAPDEFLCIYTHARMLSRQYEDQRAIALLEQALAQRPEHYGALYLLGVLQTQQQAWKKALLTFQKAQRYHPAEPEIYITIADVQWHRQQPQLAIEGLLAGLRSCPETADLHHKLAQLYSRLAYEDEVLEHLGLALDERPDDVPLLCSLAAFYWQSNALDECIEVADHIASIAPETWQAHQLKAQCLHAKGLLPQAETSYQKAHRCHPKHPDPAGQWAALLMQQQDPARYPQAVELFQTAIRNAPSEEYAYHEALAILFDLMSLPHKARAVRRMIPSSQPGQPKPRK